MLGHVENETLMCQPQSDTLRLLSNISTSSGSWKSLNFHSLFCLRGLMYVSKIVNCAETWVIWCWSWCKVKWWKLMFLMEKSVTLIPSLFFPLFRFKVIILQTPNHFSSSRTRKSLKIDYGIFILSLWA